MDTGKYLIFLKVLEERSFSKAAEELGYTQSAISHSVYSLEKAFGFKLLNRENGNISLTRAGIDVLPYIRSVVNAQNLLDFTLSSYQRLESGTLTIATIPSLAIQHFPGLLQAFNREYPKIHVVVLDGNYEEVEEMLASGRVDFGFTSLSETMPFSTFSLFRERLDAILPADHPLAAKERLSLTDLENEVFIMPGEGPTHQVGKLIRDYNLKFRTVYSVFDDNLTVSMISHGLGVSILPQMSYEHYLNFSFAARPLVEKPSRTVGVIHNHIESISPISKAFLRFSRRYFQVQFGEMQ